MTWFTCAPVLPCCLCTETMEWSRNSAGLRYGDCRFLPNTNCDEKNFESGAKREGRSGFRKQDIFFFGQICMKKFDAEKIFFDKLTGSLTYPFTDNCIW